MSRKLSLIPIGVIIVAGAAWAGSLLFPDTVTFPRFPGGAGTLSGALSLFDPITGSARDTQKLGGTGSLGYLKGSVCPNPYEVWRGIDASGNAICGKNLPILSIGTFYELAPGCAEVMKRGTTTWIAGDTVSPLQSGDVVKTKNQVECEFTSIRFVADDSILRLDKNTIVELQTGELDGNTIAQAILQDGSLWGRVLTSTGVNIGGGGLIAGVRGTSVNVEKNLINNRLHILDSRRVDAGRLLRTGDVGNVTMETASTGRTWELSATSQYSVANPKWMAMQTSRWIRENMKKDIRYLRSLPQEGNVPAELLAATPIGTEKNTICIDYDGNGTDGNWFGDIYQCQSKNTMAVADYVAGSDGTLTFGYTYSTGVENTGCTPGGSSCWTPLVNYCSTGDRLVGTSGKCEPESGLSWGGIEFTKIVTQNEATGSHIGRDGWAFDCGLREVGVTYPLDNGRLFYGGPADKYIGSGALTLYCMPSTATNPNITPILGNVGVDKGVNIVTTGQYMRYEIPASLGGYNFLKGRTIMIELGGPAGGAATSGKFYLADFGGEKWFLTKNQPCSVGGTPGNHLCKTTSNPSPSTVSVRTYNPASERIFSGTISTTPSQMIIGNNTPLSLPIGTIISKIIIQ